ncbi:MAG: J domain-containing protein [Evtepia sp.]
MIDDPYKVLGVSPSAGDDEIKAAYRRLAKKYHPDLNPGDAAAAKKMNEINAAYDAIKNPQANSYAGRQQDPFGGFGGFGSWTQGGGRSDEFQTAEFYIRSRQYMDALYLLNQMAGEKRGGRWYYLSSLANYGVGNKTTALEQIRHAVALDPENVEYQNAARQMQSGSQYYRTQGGGYQTVMGDWNRLCTTLCCAQCCCRYCSGGCCW